MVPTLMSNVSKQDYESADMLAALRGYKPSRSQTH